MTHESTTLVPEWLKWGGLIIVGCVVLIALGSGSVAAHDHMNCQNTINQQQETCIHQPDTSDVSTGEPEPQGEMTISEREDIQQAAEKCESHARAASHARTANAWGTEAVALGQLQECMKENRYTHP